MAKVFNQEAFFHLIDGDRALFQELYQLYHQEWMQIVQDLKGELHKGDAEQVAALAHRLKGMTRNFFAEDTAALCGEVEDLALCDKYHEITPKIDPLVNSLQILDKALLECLNSFQ